MYIFCKIVTNPFQLSLSTNPLIEPYVYDLALKNCTKEFGTCFCSYHKIIFSLSKFNSLEKLKRCKIFFDRTLCCFSFMGFRSLGCQHTIHLCWQCVVDNGAIRSFLIADIIICWYTSFEFIKTKEKNTCLGWLFEMHLFQRHDDMLCIKVLPRKNKLECVSFNMFSYRAFASLRAVLPVAIQRFEDPNSF